MSLVSKLNHIAIKLLPFAQIFVGLAIAAMAFLLFAFFYFPPEQNKLYTMPALVGFLWSLMAFVFVHLLSSVPSKKVAKPSFLQRIKYRVVSVFYFVVFIVFVLLTLASVVASVRFISVLAV